MYQGLKLGIVVPAYNEEALIARTIKSMPDYADRIYVIDDGSTDSTRKIISKHVDGRVCLLGDGINRGVGAAIVTGYKKALEEDMDVVAVMAGDNQMDGNHLPGLLSPVMTQNADYAKGNRLLKLGHTRGMSPWRLFGNWVLTFLTKAASGYWRIGDPQNGYTVITKRGLKKIDLDSLYPRYGYCNHLLAKLNIARCKVVDVAIPAVYGEEKSKIRYRKYITTVAPLLLRCFTERVYLKYVWQNATEPQPEPQKLPTTSFSSPVESD